MHLNCRIYKTEIHLNAAFELIGLGWNHPLDTDKNLDDTLLD